MDLESLEDGRLKYKVLNQYDEKIPGNPGKNRSPSDQKIFLKNDKF